MVAHLVVEILDVEVAETSVVVEAEVRFSARVILGVSVGIAIYFPFGRQGFQRPKYPQAFCVLSILELNFALLDCCSGATFEALIRD